VRHARREGAGSQLTMAAMDQLYGRRARPEPEPFAAKVRRLHRQGLRAASIALLTGRDLEDVLEALRRDVSA
jgi:hypothetical protein